MFTLRPVKVNPVEYSVWKSLMLQSVCGKISQESVLVSRVSDEVCRQLPEGHLSFPTSDVGSIPIARSINLDDSVDLTRLSY